MENTQKPASKSFSAFIDWSVEVTAGNVFILELPRRPNGGKCRGYAFVSNWASACRQDVSLVSFDFA